MEVVMAVQVERWRSLRSADAMDWTKVAVAIWFFVAPWVLGYANATSTAGQAGGGASDLVSAMSWNAWIAAVLLAGIAVCAIAERERWQQWATLMLGAWLFI